MYLLSKIDEYKALLGLHLIFDEVSYNRAWNDISLHKFESIRLNAYLTPIGAIQGILKYAKLWTRTLQLTLYFKKSFFLLIWLYKLSLQITFNKKAKFYLTQVTYVKLLSFYQIEFLKNLLFISPITEWTKKSAKSRT